MKVLALPVEMVSYTDNKGDIKPIRFRMQVGDEPMQVIKIDKVIVKDTEKLAGNIMIIYKCQSVIDGAEKLYELKYEMGTCRWILFKI
ncbi:hypothetical protein K2F40_12415 [Clostridium sp. CM028]|uniref:hypothetical protein n=1 Tax=unclassified Clostridium TaxID=2614128 RepID=UPI001C6EC1F2|nr:MULTISPECIES: hypothetical protein [unclassified Clostridium]MBW9145838.1 hypothetical protein [Clostridium sp. CM027]MBW9149762.1 hypothetical protein [Clostridium sp. CM028]UVE42100.1 hypothetical protein KTC92_06530 [Clostridium sp. CM027]WLC62711.1 hypothetical protein KTC94_05455 [Clostridium sp. CM028]